MVVRDSDLTGLDLTDATLQSVSFINCLSLHLATGLESILHKKPWSWQCPSSLDAATIRASIQHLPDVFVLGLGYSQEEVTAWRELYPETPGDNAV